MPEPTNYSVRLHRRSEFPIDMLRYADSTPADGASQELIGRLNNITDPKADLDTYVEVQLVAKYGLTDGAIRRWQSFGVVVNSEDAYLRAIISSVTPAPRGPKDPVTDQELQELRFARNAYLSALADWKQSGEPRRGRAQYNLKETTQTFQSLLLKHGAGLVEEVMTSRVVGAFR